MSYILFQSRKKNVLLYITAQLLSSVDKRYRELSDLFIVAIRKSENFSYYVYKKTIFIGTININYEKASLFFDYYDTNQIIFTNNSKILFDIQNSEEKLDDIEKYAKEIQEFYQKQKIKLITRNLVDLYITTHSTIPKFLASGIHAIIKLNKNNQSIQKEKGKKKTSKKKGGKRK